MELYQTYSFATCVFFPPHIAHAHGTEKPTELGFGTRQILAQCSRMGPCHQAGLPAQTCRTLPVSPPPCLPLRDAFALGPCFPPFLSIEVRSAHGQNPPRAVCSAGRGLLPPSSGERARTWPSPGAACGPLPTFLGANTLSILRLCKLYL